MSSIDDNSTPSQAPADAFSLSAESGLILIYNKSAQGLLCVSPNRPFVKAINHATQAVVLYRPPCHSWGCPACAGVNAYKAQRRGVIGSEVLAAGGSSLDFVTLTSHPRLDAAASIPVFYKAFRNLLYRAKRAASESEYYGIIERQQNGRVHIHMLCTARLTKRWWKDNAAECGLGHQSDAQEVRDLGGTAFYLTKYLAKTLQNTNLPKGTRRIRPSGAWPKLPERPTPVGWQFMPIQRNTPITHEIEVYQNMGYVVALSDEIAAWGMIDLYT